MATEIDEISPVPEAGHRGVDTRDDFVSKQEIYQDYQRTDLQPELNTSIGQINTVAGEIEINAQTASDAATTASALSNNQGDWSVLTGALNIPASVNHDDAIWALNVNLADITASEPDSENSDWTLASGIDELIDDTTPQLGGDLDANDKTFNGSSYRQIADASLGSGTHTFDYANGDYQELTVTGDITIDFDNFVIGNKNGMEIDFINMGAWTPTLPAGMEYVGGEEATFSASGKDKVIVTKDSDEVYSMFVVGLDVKAVP